MAKKERKAKPKEPAPLSIRELRPDETPEMIVGGKPPYVVPGSKPYECVECGGEAWLAPSGQKIVKQHGCRVMCMECAFAIMPPDTELMHGPKEEVAAEILSFFKKKLQ